MIIKIYFNILIMLSTILDISSFFIGMLINLLLIALICYYFKRKYESLELAQNEQAKILYNLIQNQTPRKQFDIADIMKTNFISNTVCEETQCVVEEESDSETDSESESSSSEEDEVKVLELKEPEVVEFEKVETPFLVNKIVDEDDVQLNVDEVEVELTLNEGAVDTNEVLNKLDYNKLTIKELRDVLTKKGISSNHRMKKTDLIQLIEVGKNDTLNLSDEITEVNI
jgi:hypothetical protein